MLDRGFNQTDVPYCISHCSLPPPRDRIASPPRARLKELPARSLDAAHARQQRYWWVYQFNSARCACEVAAVNSARSTEVLVLGACSAADRIASQKQLEIYAWQIAWHLLPQATIVLSPSF